LFTVQTTIKRDINTPENVNLS